MNRVPIDDLAGKISKLVPPMPGELKKEFEQTVRQLLRSALEKMSLVSREEFDIQMAVLQKTRAKLESLETRVNELEAALKQK